MFVPIQYRVRSRGDTDKNSQALFGDLALSGHNDSLSRTAALDAGASAFVTKSDSFDELVSTILEACGRE